VLGQRLCEEGRLSYAAAHFLQTESSALSPSVQGFLIGWAAGSVPLRLQQLRFERIGRRGSTSAAPARAPRGAEGKPVGDFSRGLPQKNAPAGRLWANAGPPRSDLALPTREAAMAAFAKSWRRES
jgi:hypothetical protein